MRTIFIDGKQIEFAVRSSRRARRMSLRVFHDGTIQVVIPFRLRSLQIDYEDLLRTRSAWISERLKRIAEDKEHSKPLPLATGSVIHYLGTPVTIQINIQRARDLHARLHNHVLHLFVQKDDSKHALKALAAWCIEQAKDFIPRRVAELCAGTDFHFEKIIVRNQRRRWGSCSRRKTLSFNWRLMLAPPFVLDYLIIHELAHLKEMNHSSRYWSLVAEYFPRYQEAETWLKTEGKRVFWN